MLTRLIALKNCNSLKYLSAEPEFIEQLIKNKGLDDKKIV